MRRVRLLCQAVSLAFIATSVWAQAPRERVEVTGSNIKRIQTEGALPLQVISREQIDRAGIFSAEELMTYISANANGLDNLSSKTLIVGATDVENRNSTGNSSANLRGLGAGNTLVLLNGRRVALHSMKSASVDLNSIPFSAVERVEILKDGASAIYGTDAIGGVINFILRKDFTGAEVSAYGTMTEGGGGNTRRYAGTIGFGDINKQRFNLLVSADYQKDTPLKADQRKFGSTGIRPDLGFSQTSGNTAPANFVFAGQNLNLTAINGCSAPNQSYQINAATGQPAPLQTFCRQDFTAALDIYPPSERKGFFTRGAFQIATDHQIFAEYHLSQNEITFGSSETPVNDFTGAGPILYPAGGRYYPTVVNLPGGGVV